MGKKPNIVFIITDQQHAGMLSCTGNSHVSTPHLDRLAAEGIRFEKAYCTNPVCTPSRFSMMTGVYPSRIGMETVEDMDKNVPPQVLEHALGNVFKNAGYRTLYGGKIHLPGPEGSQEEVQSYGFEYITDDARQGLANACAKFIRETDDQPFLLVASFINPHDICYMAINDYLEKKGKDPIGGDAWAYLKEALRLPEGMDRAEFVEKYCPPLPANFEIPQQEISAFMAEKPEFMHVARQQWTEHDWRLHRYAYARLTEVVDGEIGIILDAIAQSGQGQDTIICFTSDHGEQDGAHRLEHKAFLYEESVRVPFIMQGRDVVRGVVDNDHLVVTGIDILKTLCDASGVPVPTGLEGMSVWPLATGETVHTWRDHLIVENHMARLVHMGQWKYMVGRDERHTDEECLHCRIYTNDYNNHYREMLFDIVNDPGEMFNRVDDPAAHRFLEKGRERIRNRSHVMGEHHYQM
jgi:arylsulfatase A-like enzyme